MKRAHDALLQEHTSVLNIRGPEKATPSPSASGRRTSATITSSASCLKRFSPRAAAASGNGVLVGGAGVEDVARQAAAK